MELKNILKAAKMQISELLSLGETHYRVEQANYNRKTKNWEIVISFLIEKLSKPPESSSSDSEEKVYERTYKVVMINDDGEVMGFYMYKE